MLSDAQEANGGGGGLIAYAPQDGGGGDADGGKRQVIAFEGTDVKGRTGRLNKGDPVQFFITTDVRTGKRRASQVFHFPWLPYFPHLLAVPVLQCTLNTSSMYKNDTGILDVCQHLGMCSCKEIFRGA